MRALYSTASAVLKSTYMKFTSKHNLFHGFIGFFVLLIPLISSRILAVYSESRYPEFEINRDIFKITAYDEYYVGIVGAVVLLLVLAVVWSFFVKKLNDDELRRIPLAYFLVLGLCIGFPGLLSMATFLFTGVVEWYESILIFIDFYITFPGISLSYIGALPMYLLVTYVVRSHRAKKNSSN